MVRCLWILEGDVINSMCIPIPISLLCLFGSLPIQQLYSESTGFSLGKTVTRLLSTGI